MLRGVTAEDVSAILAGRNRMDGPRVWQLSGPGPFSPRSPRPRASDTHLARGGGGRPLPKDPPRAASHAPASCTCIFRASAPRTCRRSSPV